jgi:hypothetical protein
MNSSRIVKDSIAQNNMKKSMDSIRKTAQKPSYLIDKDL